MKIAFISYEFPQDTADGGIATYVRQVAEALYGRGHTVEVFTASRCRSGAVAENGITVHRIFIADRSQFPDLIAPLFLVRHKEMHFDILEGPDYCAEARTAVSLTPELPYVVRLHTPEYLVGQVRYSLLPPKMKLRLRRLRLRHREKPAWNPYASQHTVERLHIQNADGILGISKAITQIVEKSLHLPQERLCTISNPYVPPQTLLDIPVNTETNRITFLGRLQERKGVLDLARAIPMALNRFPQARFRFVGRSVDSPSPNMDMKSYLERMLYAWRDRVEFCSEVPLDEVPSILSETDICVFPSLWENFPYVCLEAMAAGRGVVGSSAGGMGEILEGGKAGLQIRPNHPEEIGRQLLRFLRNPALRMEMGEIARSRILSAYSAEKICPQLETAYEQAILHRKRMGPRSVL